MGKNIRIALLFVLSVLFVSASGALAPVDQPTAESWAQSIVSSFSLVEQRLIFGTQHRDNYLGATQVQTPVVGEQEVALLAVRLTSILNAKLSVLKATRDSYIANFATSTSSVPTLQASDVVGNAAVGLYLQPVDINSTAVKFPPGLTSSAIPSAALNQLWVDNRAKDNSIAYQYFGAVDGSTRFYPAQKMNAATVFDARLTSWYGTALAPHKKVVIIVDSNVALTQAVVDQVSAFLNTLSETDRVGVISSLANSSISLNTTDGCSGDVLLRGSAFTVSSLKAALSSKLGTKASMDMSVALKRAFALIGTQAQVNDEGTTPVIAVFSSTEVSDLTPVLNDLLAKYNSEPKIFTYAVGSNSDRFQLRRLACVTGGGYYEIGATNSSSAAAAANYLQLLQPVNGFSSVAPQWTTGIGFRPDLSLGVVLSAIVPVVVNGKLQGVLGMDVTLSDVIAPFDAVRRLTSYGFLTTLFGDTLVHPRLNTAGVVVPPYTRDITIFETSPEFPTLVRAPMLAQQAGAVSYDLSRPLVQGDSTFNSEKLVQIRGYYYWQQLNSLPFVVVRTYAEQDLTDYDYDLVLPPGTILYFFNWMTLQGTPYYPPTTKLDASGSALTFMMYQGGPTSYTRPGISYANMTVYNETFKYINDLPGAFNPGIDRQVKSEGRVLKLNEPNYIAGWATYAAQFQLQLLYSGTPTGLTGMYPALAIPVLINFLPARRPWYQVAVSNPGALALTAPYVDAAIGNTVCTITSAITADASRTRLLTVASVDLTYPPLHTFVFSTTGCRLLQTDVNSPACFLFDESAILTTSFRFFDPIRDPATNQTTPIRTVFLGEDEPELADALIKVGLIVSSPVDDYTQSSDPARRTFPYRVDSTKLASGTLSGSFSSPCETGSYYVMKITGTNCYLAVIHDYTFNGRNITGCPSYESSRSTPVPYSVCQGGNQTYGSFVRSTLNNDPAALEQVRLQTCSGVPQAVETIHGNDAAPVILMVFAALVIAATFATLVIMFMYRRTPVMRTANEAFVYVHLVGIMLGVATVFPWAVTPNKVSCVFIPFLGGLGFILCFGAMLAKMIRIQRILSNTSLVSIPISTKDLIVYTGVMVALEVIFLIIWQAARTLEPGLSAKSSGSTTYLRVCKCKDEWVFTGIQIGYFGLLVLTGCVISILTRRVHTKILWSEPRWIAYSMYYVLVMGAILVVVRAVIRRDATLQFILTALAIIFMGFGVLLLTYGVRLYVIFFKPKQNDSASATGGGTGVSEFSSEFKPDALEF